MARVAPERVAYGVVATLSLAIGRALGGYHRLLWTTGTHRLFMGGLLLAHRGLAAMVFLGFCRCFCRSVWVAGIALAAILIDKFVVMPATI